MIEQTDNLLTKEECDQIIDYGKSLDMDIYDKGRYYYSDIMRRKTMMEDAFSPSVLQPAYHALVKLKKSYIKSFPEVNNLDPWTLDYVRFKWWKPEDHYDKWHSEHDFCQPYRTLSFLLYLSDNNCSTHFRRHQSVATRAGRGIMFPAYFTHEHRGEQCKDGLDRYMLSGYYSFYEVIK